MKKTIVKLAIPFLIIGLFSLPSEAKRGRGGFLKIMKELDLTDAQKAELKKLRGKKEDRKNDRKKIRNLRTQLQAAMVANSSDAELLALFKELKEARDTSQTKRFKQMLEIRKILTPEQRVKFQEMRRQRGRGFRHRFSGDEA